MPYVSLLCAAYGDRRNNFASMMSKTNMHRAPLFWLVVLIVAASIIGSSQIARPQHTYIEPEDDLDEFVGKVKTIQVDMEEHEFTTDFMDFGSLHKRKPFQVKQFDRDGKKLEQFHYRTDGVPMPKTTYTYDEKGLLLKENHFSAVSGEPHLETVYSYDSRGRVKDVIQRRLDDGKVLSRKIYTHDEQGKYTELAEYDWDNKLRDKLAIVWDNDGKVSEVSVLSPKCDGQCREQFTYDNKGRVVEITTTLPNASSRKEKDVYEDDQRGNWTRKTVYYWMTEKGKSFYKLMYITYRTLTYY